MYDTIEEAQIEELKLKRMRASYGGPPVERRIVERWGKYEIVVVKHCSRCGAEVFNAFSSPVLCPECRKRRELHAAQEAWEDGEKRRAAMRRAEDFERVQQ